MDLTELPQVLAQLQHDVRELQALRREVKELRARQLKWVNDEQARQITGLSRDTLRRHRKAADSLIVWKDDGGIRYDYDSLLAHNDARAIGRGRLSRLIGGQP